MNHKWQVAIYFDYFVGHFVQQKQFIFSQEYLFTWCSVVKWFYHDMNKHV